MSQKQQAFVKTFTGKTIIIDVDTDTTIADAKQQFAEQEDLEVETLKFLLNGKQLDDDFSLANVVHLSDKVFHCFQRLVYRAELEVSHNWGDAKDLTFKTVGKKHADSFGMLQACVCDLFGWDESEAEELRFEVQSSSVSGTKITNTKVLDQVLEDWNDKHGDERMQIVVKRKGE